MTYVSRFARGLEVILAGLLLAHTARAQPVVTGLVPVAAAAGATVVISGTGFSATAGRNAVTFGAVRAAVTAATATQLTVRVPVGAASVAPVTVTDLVSRQQGSSLASATPLFTLRFAGAGLNAASYQATRYPVATAQLLGTIGRNIAAADFNADNYPDFAIVADGQLLLTFGNGLGGYGPPLQLPAGTRPQSVQAADVNADGATDLLVGTATDLLLLRNLGNGNGFVSAAPINLNGRTVVEPLDVEDLNADGLPDLLALVGNGGAQQGGPVQLVELRNNGTGFDAPTLLLTELATGMAVADFNRDGRPDIALLGPAQFFSQPPFRVLLLTRNAANTGYDAPVASLLSNFTTFLPPQLADTNADGQLDLVISGSLNATAATVVAQRTATGFALQGPFPSISVFTNNAQLIVDADGNGLPDLLGGTSFGGAGFAVQPGLPGGSFGPGVDFNVTAGGAFTAGDFDLDGRTDLATYDISSGDLIVYRYTGLGPNINNPPTLNALADLTLAEDAPQQTVALTGIGNGGEAGQAVTITATSDNPALVPNPSLAYFSPTSTGTLRLQPAPDAFGSCLITVTASDGQPQNSTVVRTFRVTVSPVNDAPTLDAIPDVVLTQVISLTAPIAVPLSGITSGAANENQLLTLSATASLTGNGGIGNGSIAYASPATTGQYTVVIQPLAQGLFATVTITVNDGQATNNTTSRTFRIFYNPGTTPGLPTTAPTLDAIADVTADRARPVQLPVALAGIGDGDPNQVLPLAVVAVSSDPALVSLGAVSYTSPAATGALPYTISSTRGGTATVSVTVSNGQAQNGSITRSFRVTVPAAPVISSSLETGGSAIVALYPNPAPGGRFALAGAGPGPLDVTVLDLSGRIVLQQHFMAGPQPLLLALPPAAAAGLYAVRVRSAGSTVVRRLAVE